MLPDLPIRRILAALVLATISAACSSTRDASTIASRFGPDSVLWRRMLEAEDARGSGSDGISPLMEGARAENAALRAIAVRGIGRLERADLADSAAILLDDPDADVRSQAANAVAQSVRAGDPTAAWDRLANRLETENDAGVRAIILEGLGRMPIGSPARLAQTATLIASHASASSAEDRLGVARAFHFLLRQRVARSGVPPAAIETLRSLAMDRSANDETTRRMRTVAVAALANAGALGPTDIEAVLADPDPFVRREAVPPITLLTDPGIALHLAARALADESPNVRYDGLRAYDRVRNGEERCGAYLEAAGDADIHVRLLAIDLLGSDCGGAAGRDLLVDRMASLPEDASKPDPDWHPAAHAVVSLARTYPEIVKDSLGRFLRSANPFVRAYAARAAALLRDETALRTLAADADPNVRTEAVNGLHAVASHAADSVYIAQLRDQNDSQLLQAAATALEGTTDPAATGALLDALDRISTARRETWRDSRMALLQHAIALGDASSAQQLRPYLSDYDPRVAATAADAIGRWTGSSPSPAPSPPGRLALPSADEIEALASSRVTIEMADGGSIGIELLAYDAPTNAWRFARLARDGYYDGLTLHRVVPNFVVQGGSPDANEYTGDGPFSRDELGLAFNWRGTVGLSTRGRDTGDAQFYFNLIDNVRLDHDYTIFARVTSGMDVVDRLTEGAVIRRITIGRPD